MHHNLNSDTPVYLKGVCAPVYHIGVLIIASQLAVALCLNEVFRFQSSAVPNTTLQPGTHVYPFTCQIPQGCV